jgi:hypothetical protein
MCDVCNNLKGKAVVDKDLYYNLLDEVILTKANTNEPDFKVDANMGEGKAGKDELKYRQELQDLLESLWKDVKTADDEDIPELINTFIEEGQTIAEEYINKIYDKNVEIALDKLEEIGIKTKAPKTSKPKDALLAWQLFAVERIGRQLELDIKHERLAKRYFEAAYGSKKKAN